MIPHVRLMMMKTSTSMNQRDLAGLKGRYLAGVVGLERV
jgi:hypothetical protein